MTPRDISADTIAQSLSLFIARDQVAELRALDVGGPRCCYAGWFDGRHLREMATAALGLTRRASGVYFTPNPVAPSLLARCPNRVDRYYQSIGYSLTTDADILERRYLLIDLDPDRIDQATGEPVRGKCPSTYTELRLAREAADAVETEFVKLLRWKPPLRMCSGNGIHLLFPLSTPIPPTLPEYEEDPIRHFFRAYGDTRYQNRVAFDPNTHTASRMIKVPGTWAKKGRASFDRPYRLAEILAIPAGWSVPEKVTVSHEQPTTTRDRTDSAGQRVGTATSTATGGTTTSRTPASRHRRRNRSESGSLFDRSPTVDPGPER